MARVRAVLRRASRSAPEPERGRRRAAARPADVELDEERWTVHRAGIPVELSPTEFRLLAYLMRHEGRVLTRAQLLENVWGWDYSGESQIVETYVSYLRRKLDPLGPAAHPHPARRRLQPPAPAPRAIGPAGGMRCERCWQFPQAVAARPDARPADRRDDHVPADRWASSAPSILARQRRPAQFKSQPGQRGRLLSPQTSPAGTRAGTRPCWSRRPAGRVPGAPPGHRAR